MIKPHLLNPLQYPVIIFALTVVILASSCNRRASQVSTISKGQDSMSFLIIGDWGRKGGQAQSDVARQMDVYARKHNVQFIISTGDNFYPAGVNSVNDPQWKTSFENVYNKPGLDVEWYSILGNHDYVNNPASQVAYSGVNDKWNMPARYYSLNKTIDRENSVLLLFTDTSPFVKQYHSGGMGDVHLQDTAAQMKWIKQQLEASDDEWKLVIGHHPVYSAGPHDNTSEMIKLFKPVFSETNTDFYISGHDHSLQHLFEPGEPVHYLVSGGGSQATRVKQHDYKEFARAIPGFIIMTLYTGEARLYFYNKFGRLIYNQEIDNPSGTNLLSMNNKQGN